MFKRQNYVSEATMFRRLLLAYYISSRLRKTAYLQVNGNDDHKVGIILECGLIALRIYGKSFLLICHKVEKE